MGIFCLLAVLAAFRGFRSGHHIYIYLIISGLFIFLATLSKGVPGLFPIIVAVAWWLTHRSFSFPKMCLYTLILVLVPSIIYALLMLWPEARESLSIYVSNRLIGRIDTEPTVTFRAYTLHRLSQEILPSLIITALILVTGRLAKIPAQFRDANRRNAIFFFLVALSGILPLMLTMVQKAVYFTHAIPYLATGLALLAAPTVANLLKRINVKRIPYKTFFVVTVLLLAGSTALDLSLRPIAEYCRQLVLDHNPNHLMRRWSTFQEAAGDEEFQCFVRQLQRRYPQEKAERLLQSLGVELGNERQAYFSDYEYAAALLGTTPDSLDRMFGDQSP